MPDGESGAVSCSAGGAGADGSDVHLDSSSSSAVNETCEGDRPMTMEKDPRKKARRYQLELCKKAVEENIIVYLGTGCGKTHIAVLLMYELGRFIPKHQKSVCVFLAPTVFLVQQQAKVITESTDFKVGIYCGGSKHPKSHSDWEKEISGNEVLAMTPELLLRSLHHCFIRMEFISLLIFDECHHAQVNSSHPYAQIMKMFYETNGSRVPRIFGMTASPIVGKGSSDPENLPKSINSLEILLNAKVYSVENNEELESFVASPVVKVYYYCRAPNDTSSPNMIYQNTLEEIKQQCLTSLAREAANHRSHQSRLNMKKLLKRTHENVIYGLKNLGLWGALQATRLLLSGDHSIREELMEEKQNSNDLSLSDMYLAQAAKALSSGLAEGETAFELSSISVLKDPFFSKKLLRLVGILSTFRSQPNMKCIIFVNRIITARSLSWILNNVKFLSAWKSHFLIGVNSGLKSISRKNMKTILERFRSGELNLLVATKVGEEGLDIQTCCLVIRFDLPETVASFIQSRGRARMPESEYAFLVDGGNQKELDLIKNFEKDEDRMNSEITSRTSKEIFPRLEGRVYTVDSTGASISEGYSISLLHYYCSRLPHDEFFQPKPEFYYIDDLGGTVCHLVLPSNAPIHQIVSTELPSMEAAKKDACLTAIEKLHELGVLNDFLLPESKEDNEEELTEQESDSDSSEGEESSRGELYEMLVPSLLKQPWDSSMNCVSLHSYYVKFVPRPKDRVYRKFGLFLKSPLPVEAEKMELDLHLAGHRSVLTKLFPAGITEFDNDEIKLAELFQEVCLKVILERAELIPEFVPLGIQDSFKTGVSSFYLLLPVNVHDDESIVTVDWKTIRRCLSSPIFKDPSDPVEYMIPPTGSHLQLANGCWGIDDVKNSLVFAIHKKLFYFVSDVLHERNGYSPFNESSTESHVETTYNMYGIRLRHPEQPLLLVKPLFNLRNLLHDRKPKDLEPHEHGEYFIEVPPELFELKITGFSKDIGSSLSLLPSIMHRLENLLVAIELKLLLSASIPEAAEVNAHRVLEALTTENCLERFSLERLEVLGDAFLKFAVGRRLFLLYNSIDEGELTRRRSDVVRNSSLFRLAIRSNLQVYIRDQQFDPGQFFAFGHPCTVTCDEGAAKDIHSSHRPSGLLEPNAAEIRCSKVHHYLHRKTIADVVEALVGAFIVDSGFRGATAFLKWIGIDVGFEPSQLRNTCIASKFYMPLAALIDLDALENLLGYKFLHKGLLLQAFVHPSYNKHGGGCYQRLEFLGDAVLDYLITSYFFTVYPNVKPGQLTDLRSLSVNNKAFANVAVNLSLDKFLLCDSVSLREAVKDYKDFLTQSPSESGLSECPKCPKVLGDLIESCLGAILLDTGFNLSHVWKMMLSFLDPVKSLSSVQPSPVRELLEICQFHKWDQEILEQKKNGAFSIVLKVTKNGTCIAISEATRGSKKESKRMAVQLMIVKLKAQGYVTPSNPLKKLLKSSCREDARLIGYNEEPIDVMDPGGLDSGERKLEEHFDGLTITDSKDIKASSSICIKPIITQPVLKAEDRLSQRITGDGSLGTTSNIKGGSIKKTARSLLYETCIANCWKPPYFECCEEEGPGHLKSFTFKVILEVEEAPDMALECYGEPRSTKKGAAENAAQAAMWYLEHAGFLP